MGGLVSLWSESFPPASKFVLEDIPDLAGKVMIVTGANTGIGKETAKALLTHNAKVYIAARNAEKATLAIADLKRETNKEALLLRLDLSDLQSVQAAAKEFNSKEKELHVLFNNAGVMVPPVREITAQGYDLQFGTNVLGHFYLTKLLLPALLAGAKSSSDGKARVINTSSSVAGKTIDFKSLKDTPERKKKLSWQLYSQSKLGNVLFSDELARRYGDEGIISASVNPGNLRTELGRNLSKVEAAIISLVLHPAHLGALTQLWAGTSPEVASLNGQYFIPWARVGKSRPGGNDYLKLSGELWTWMEDQVAHI